MAYSDKAALMSALTEKLGDVMTANEMRRVMDIVNEELDSYELRRTAAYDDDEGQDDLLDVYVSAMRVQGRSEKTIERYVYIIGRMTAKMNVHTRSVNVYHLRQFMAEEKARGISDTTLEGYRQIFSAYFNWLQRENLISVNPTANLGAIRCQKKLKAIYSDVDIERLKLCAGTRDRAIITFLGSTGCRISEVTQLNRQDVDLINLECKVLGKGNKERTVYLSQVAGMALRDYLGERKDDHEALFIGKGTTRMTPHGVRFMLNKLAGRCGVEHVHPHKFRRTLATNLIRHGMPIQEVAAILGHDKLDTTMEYVVLDRTDVKNAYRKYA